MQLKKNNFGIKKVRLTKEIIERETQRIALDSVKLRYLSHNINSFN